MKNLNMKSLIFAGIAAIGLTACGGSSEREVEAERKEESLCSIFPNAWGCKKDNNVEQETSLEPVPTATPTPSSQSDSDINERVLNYECKESTIGGVVNDEIYNSETGDAPYSCTFGCKSRWGYILASANNTALSAANQLCAPENVYSYTCSDDRTQSYEKLWTLNRDGTQSESGTVSSQGCSNSPCDPSFGDNKSFKKKSISSRCTLSDFYNVSHYEYTCSGEGVWETLYSHQSSYGAGQRQISKCACRNDRWKFEVQSSQDSPGYVSSQLCNGDFSLLVDPKVSFSSQGRRIKQGTSPLFIYECNHNNQAWENGSPNNVYIRVFDDTETYGIVERKEASGGQVATCPNGCQSIESSVVLDQANIVNRVCL